MPYLLLLLCLLLSISCDLGKDIHIPESSTDLAFPLGNATFEPTEFLLNLKLPAVFTINSKGVLVLSYKTELQKSNAYQFIGSIDNFIPPVIPLVQAEISHTLSLPNGVIPLSVQFKEGSVQWFFENPFNENITISLRLPFLDGSNNPVVQTLSLPAFNGVGAKPIASNTANPYSLKDKSLIIKDKKISVSYEAKGLSGKIYVLPNAALKLSNLLWGSIKATFNPFEIDFGQTTKSLDFLKPFYLSNLDFNNPELKLIFEHNFIVPIQISIPSLLMDLGGGKMESLIAFNNNQVFNLGFSPSSAILSRDSAISISNPNPLRTILQKKATSLHFNLKASLSSAALPGGYGVIHENDELLVSASLNIPLNGQLSQYPLTDTIPLNLGILEKVNRGVVRIISKNSIPLSVLGQCYFIDKKGTVLDSLMVGGPKILSNPMTTNISSPKTEIIDLLVSETKMKSLRLANRLVVKALLSTIKLGQESVEIRKDQQFSLKISLIVNY